MRCFKDWKPPSFDEDGWAYSHDNKIRYGWRCQHFEKLRMGCETDIGCFTYMNAKHGIVMGLGVQVGANCSIYSESTIDGKKGKVIIGDFVRIGAGSVIMPGVTLGNDALVAACSFVNRDVPAGDVVGGVPACSLNIERKIGCIGRHYKTARCLGCDSIMRVVKMDIVRMKPMYYYRCENCGCMVSFREGMHL